jgi:hypothetical protein
MTESPPDRLAPQDWMTAPATLAGLTATFTALLASRFGPPTGRNRVGGQRITVELAKELDSAHPSAAAGLREGWRRH